MTPRPFVPLGVTWRPLRLPGLELYQNMAIEARISAELDGWLGTPYAAGCAAKGIGGGVDCIRFVCAAMDALYGFRREPIDRLPHDVALHNPTAANAALRKIIRMYEPCVHVEDGSLEPGDVVIVSLGGGGPSHAKIADTRRNTLYHATADGICMTGILEQEGTPWAVYRVQDKHRWLKKEAA